MVPGLIGLGGMGTLNVVFWDVDGTLRTPRWMDTAPPSILPFASLVFRCSGILRSTPDGLKSLEDSARPSSL